MKRCIAPAGISLVLSMFFFASGGFAAESEPASGMEHMTFLVENQKDPKTDAAAAKICEQALRNFGKNSPELKGARWTGVWEYLSASEKVGCLMEVPAGASPGGE